MEVRKINDTSGIYFSDIGTANVYQSHWVLLIDYNLATFITEYNFLDTCTNQITTLCKRLKQINVDNHDCLIIDRQLKTLLTEIQSTQEFLLPSQKITKRSLIDIGGYSLNYLFGTLDQRYQTSNDDNVKAIKSRQDFLSNLVHNHTSMMDNTVSLIQKTDADVTTQFQLFNKHLNKIDFDGNHDRLSAELHNHLNFLATYASLIFTKFRNTQSYILDILTSPYSSGLQLLSPNLLLKELLNIEKSLPNNFILPRTHNQLDTELIFKIAKMESRIFNHHLICAIHIPLLLNTNYQLFRTIAVPTKNTHGYTYIEPQRDIILVSFTREQSTYLSKTEFQSCFQNHDNKFFCESHNPIFISSTKNFDCEMQLLNHAKTIPKSCNVKQTVIGDYWIQIDSNRYIFVLNEPSTIDLLCYQNVTHYNLDNTGILQIPQKCQIRSKNLILHAGNANPQAVFGEYVPTFDISDIPPEIVIDPSKVSPTPFLLKLNESSSISDIANQIKLLKEYQLKEPPTNLHFVSNSHFYLITVFILLFLIIFTYVIHRLRLTKRLRSYQIQIIPKPEPIIPQPNPTITQEILQPKPATAPRKDAVHYSEI